MIRASCLLASCYIFFLTGTVSAQTQTGVPPAVGVVTVSAKDLTETTEFNGRIEATDIVNVVARVSAFLEGRLFTEGADVKKGDILFQLERAPYEADVEAKQAAVTEAQAALENARIAFDRADTLRKTGSGSQSALDDATASQRSTEAQVRAAKAALRTAQINLGYTKIISPIDGRIGRAGVTVGNVVSPSTGTLATVVTQDPMYVTFSVPTRKLIELQAKYASEGGTAKALKLKLRLPDGRLYGQTGVLEFTDVSVSASTDSVALRGVIENPLNGVGQRELFNDQFVRVVLESAEPQKVLTIPRAAVLTDQEGDYVYKVGADQVVSAQRINLGQSDASSATILQGLSSGDIVVVDGIQRVRPKMKVSPELVSENQANQG
jgi:membrane fusion protein, multidrug efflux system